MKLSTYYFYVAIFSFVITFLSLIFFQFENATIYSMIVCLGSFQMHTLHEIKEKLEK